MFEDAIKWLRKSWYGALVAYSIVFFGVFGIIWYFADPAGIPENIDSLPEFIAKKRIFFHLLLTIIVTAHIIIILLIFELNFFKDNSAKKYEIKIQNLTNGDDVKSPFKISGSYKIKPPEDSIRILEFSPVIAQYWIKNEVFFDESTKQWFVEKIYIGGDDGERREISVAFLGENSKAFVHYFDKANQDRDKLIGIKKLPTDIQICDKVLIKRKIPPIEG
ncbi:MAG TPA: hypothetical protein VK892_23035 [Pyrinomonadaceae bacterium]|nr:hypothetical protein [Pyrinomonadaceae bacterium]